MRLEESVVSLTKTVKVATDPDHGCISTESDPSFIAGENEALK